MRAIAYILFGIGLILMALATYDEYRGVAAVISPSRRTLKVYTSRKVDDPTGFRNLMTYEWIRAILAVTIGWGLLMFFRRLNRLDPLSPSFQGGKALDDLEKTLSERENKDRSK